jgi:hypothetical protein
MSGSLLLEDVRNTVTHPVNEYGDRFEVAKKRCKCAFCPECSTIMGYNLRKKLFPILETFSGLFMLTFTVDPSLFPDAQAAYLYMRENRCIAKTLRDLFRRGYLCSRRYFYVVEWQKDTEQAHFHVLVDARFIPWDELLMLWGKHRPESAGRVIGDRPAFGTVFFTERCFEGGAAHAARYVTKYLTKTPENGFPEWVLRLGKETRIRRYSASRGLWGDAPKKLSQTEKKRESKPRTYAERIQACGSSVNVFEIRESVDKETGEIQTKRIWAGELRANANRVLERLFDPGEPRRSRRTLLALSLSQAQRIISIAAGHDATWVRGAPSRYEAPETQTSEGE